MHLFVSVGSECRHGWAAEPRHYPDINDVAEPYESALVQVRWQPLSQPLQMRSGEVDFSSSALQLRLPAQQRPSCTRQSRGRQLQVPASPGLQWVLERDLTGRVLSVKDDQGWQMRRYCAGPRHELSYCPTFTCRPNRQPDTRVISAPQSTCMRLTGKSCLRR